jgi:ankyrin repeat protein
MAKAPPTWKDPRNVLTHATATGEFDELRAYIAAGKVAVEDARANDNQALRFACRNGHVSVVRVLVELGLTADDARVHDNDALRYACCNGHVSVVRVLV